MKAIENNLEDEQLVQAFQAGEDSAFEELVYRYKNQLFQYLLGLVKDSGVAEDLFQEVFVSFFKQKGRFEVYGKFKSWLFLAARNRAFNYFRDHKHALSLDQTDEDGNAFLQDILPEQETSVLDELSFRELEKSVAVAAEQLPPRQREMIYLRQFMSFQEIADTVGRPLGTVLADFHRAVKRMRTLLAQNAQGEKI